MSLRNKTDAVTESEWDRAIAALTPQRALRRAGLRWTAVVVLATLVCAAIVAIEVLR